MNHTMKRGRLHTAGALAFTTLLVMLMAFVTGTPAHAQAQPFPDSSDVTITKLTQPETLGDAATGEQVTSLPEGASPIGGVVFNYYRVGDINTNADQQNAASAVPGDYDLSGTPTGSFAATAANGETTATLDRGLYVIQEDPSTVPAGVTASAPFMLTVPLTNPTDLDSWLDHIYIYPKNSQVEVAKTVDNAAAHAVGDTATWTVTADIPRVQNPDSSGTTDQFMAPDYFRIDDQIQSEQLALNPAFAAGNNGAIEVSADETLLSETEHYTVTEAPADAGVEGNNYQIEFTEAGREALAAAVNSNPTAQVSVDIATTVLNTGHIQNTASIYSNQDAADQNSPLATDAVEIRYGGFNIEKLSSDSSVEDLSGAQFRVYDNADDAEAQNNQYLTPSIGPADGLWETDASGQLNINGLRYSGFANGESIGTEHENYVTYYLVETQALEGHQLLANPIEFTVNEETGVLDPWTSDLQVTNQATSGSFVLPLTGGTGTWMLTLAGIAVLVLVVFLARRRAATES